VWIQVLIDLEAIDVCSRYAVHVGTGAGIERCEGVELLLEASTPGQHARLYLARIDDDQLGALRRHDRLAQICTVATRGQVLQIHLVAAAPSSGARGPVT